MTPLTAPQPPAQDPARPAPAVLAERDAYWAEARAERLAAERADAEAVFERIYERGYADALAAVEARLRGTIAGQEAYNLGRNLDLGAQAQEAVRTDRPHHHLEALASHYAGKADGIKVARTLLDAAIRGLRAGVGR